MGIAARSGSTIVHNLSWKKSCKVASQVNIDLASAPANIDSEVMADGERVLIMAQTAPAENGIYDYNGAGNAMTRVVDANAAAELEGAAVTVQEGTDGDKQFQQIEDGITLDISAQTWTQIGGVGTPVAAADVTIADAGSRYTGIQVEAALQEIAGAGRTTETVKQNADDIAGIDSSKWTLNATDIFNDNAGNVGIGPGVGAGTVDEQLHIARAVTDGDVAILIENSEVDDGTFADTASIKFGFGGDNGVGLIQVGKLNDFSTVALSDASMRFSVKASDVLTEMLTINSKPITDAKQNTNIGINQPNPLYKLHIKGFFQEDTRILIDSSNGGDNAKISFTKDLTTLVNIGVNGGFTMETVGGSAAGVFFSRSNSNGTMTIGSGAQVTINSTLLQINPVSTGSQRIVMTNQSDTFDWELLASSVGRFHLVSTNATIFTILQASGNFGLGITNAVDEHFHINKAVDGDFVATLFENVQADAGGSLNEAILLRFGFAGDNLVGEVRVGKVNDYTSTALSDSFMAFSVDSSGTLTEALRLTEVGGLVRVGVGDFSSATVTAELHIKSDTPFLKIEGGSTADINLENTAGTLGWSMSLDSSGRFELSSLFSTVRRIVIDKTTGNVGIGAGTDIDERLHVEQPNNNGDTAILIEASTTPSGGAVLETASLKFGFGGVNDAVQLIAGKVDDFTEAAKQDASLDIQLILNGTPESFIFLKAGGTPDKAIGFGTTDPDAHIHIARAISGDFIALLLENSQALDAGTDETVKIAFAFGGINIAAGIEVGKLDDFQDAPGSDSYMELQVLGDQAVLAAIRMEGDSGAVKIGIYDGTTPVIQATKISDPAGQATDLDAEARTAIDAIIDALEGIGVSAAV